MRVIEGTLSGHSFLSRQAHLVNSFAPWILCSTLRRLMEASPDCDHYIVNVGAMEGQFYKVRCEASRTPRPRPPAMKRGWR